MSQFRVIVVLKSLKVSDVGVIYYGYTHKHMKLEIRFINYSTTEARFIKIL